MGSLIERFENLLLIAALISMVARRLRLPYTVGLTVGGLLLALVPDAPAIVLTKDLIFKALLPPLIFEAALLIDYRRLRAELEVVTALATVGVLVAAAVVAGGLHFAFGWSWQTSLVFAVLISATDPVAVIATFRGLKLHGRLPLLVEAESLFNDGTAAVLFGIALAAAGGQTLSVGGFVGSFVLTTVGGALCGALVGGAALLLAGRTDDHLVEIAFSSIAAYGSFLLAEHFGLSGVLATLTAGILVGNLGSCGAISDRGRESVLSFWEYIAFVSNSLIFLMIGVSVGKMPLLSLGAGIAGIIALVLVGRAIAVYGCCLPFAWSRHRVPMPHQHVLFWGGLRGALALALVLGLPQDFEHRQEILLTTFAVVAFSVLVQGLTVGPLLAALGIAPRGGTERVDPAALEVPATSELP